jgi:uncharacterized protein YcbK (DUF882 family)
MGHRNARNKPRKLSVAEARRNLEVEFKRTKEECFRAAKECGSESLEGFKKMDHFVRSQYYDEPKKMAEWDEIRRKYESVDEESGDEKEQDIPSSLP